MSLLRPAKDSTTHSAIRQEVTTEAISHIAKPRENASAVVFPTSFCRAAILFTSTFNDQRVLAFRLSQSKMESESPGVEDSFWRHRRYHVARKLVLREFPERVRKLESRNRAIHPLTNQQREHPGRDLFATPCATKRPSMKS